MKRSIDDSDRIDDDDDDDLSDECNGKGGNGKGKGYRDNKRFKKNRLVFNEDITARSDDDDDDFDDDELEAICSQVRFFFFCLFRNGLCLNYVYI